MITIKNLQGEFVNLITIKYLQGEFFNLTTIKNLQGEFVNLITLKTFRENINVIMVICCLNRTVSQFVLSTTLLSTTYVELVYGF